MALANIEHLIRLLENDNCIMQSDVMPAAKTLGYVDWNDAYTSDMFEMFHPTASYWNACETLLMLVLAAEGEL